MRIVPSKEHILAEIRRIAAARGASPGVRTFANETGIAMHVWRGKYWRTWGDALVEAGFSRNILSEGIPEADLMLALITLTRKLNRFPGEVDLQLERHNNAAFPSAKPFRRLGGQTRRIEEVRRYLAKHDEYADVLRYLPAVAGSPTTRPIQRV